MYLIVALVNRYVAGNMRSQHCFAILSYKCLIIFYSLWRRAEACNHWGHSLPHNQWLHHSQVIFSLGVDSCLFMWKRAGHRRCHFQTIGNFQVERTAHCSNHWVGELGEQCAISTMWEGKTNPRFLGRNLHDSSGLCCFKQMKSSWDQHYFRSFSQRELLHETHWGE